MKFPLWIHDFWRLAGTAFLIWVAIPLVWFGLKFIVSLWSVMILGLATGAM